MKKLLLFTFLFSSINLFAAWGLFDADRSYIIFNVKGTSTTKAIWNSGAGNFNETDFGTFGVTDVLTLTAYDVKTWKNNGGDVTGGTFYYMIYPKGTRPSPTTFTSKAINFIENIGVSGDQKWGFSGATINVLSGLAAGEYSIEVYCAVNGTTPSSTIYDNNNNNNYIASFKVTTAPLAPSNISITPGNTQLSVAFTPGYDGGSAITNYKYSINGGTNFIECSPAQTTSPIVITGLTNGTSYNVQIRAMNSNGDGVATSSAAATPSTTPSVPTNIVITPGNSQLSVAFTAGSDGGSAITNYKYSINGGSNFTTCSPAQTTSPIVIAGLTNGTSYNVQIRAVNANGDGVATSSAAATPSTTPSAPTITGITPSCGSLSIALTPGIDGGSAITNFKFSINGGTSFAACSPAQTTGPIVITGLTNGTSYNVLIKAVNANGDGSATGSSMATTVLEGTWIGGSTGTWETGTNWCGGMPTASTDVIIPSNVSVEIASSSLAICNSVTINTGGNLTVNTDQALTVLGTITNYADITGLVVKSGGSIKQNSAVLATVERDVTNADWADWRDGWHFLSSPVADQAIDPNFITDPITDYDFYAWWEETNEWINYKNTTVAPTWNTVNGSNNFTVGKGYMAAYDAGGTKKFEGTLNVADVPVSGLAITGKTQINRSWHLLGNPFSCALTWQAIITDWNATNIAGVAQIWNESIQDYSLLPSASTGSVIPATNGFMVQVSGGEGSLIIPEAKRIHSTQPYFKSAQSEIQQIKLLASTADNQSAKESSIMLYPDATEGYDLMYDGEFLHGFGPSFYSQQGDLKLSLNALPELPLESRIPFSFIKNDASEFTIELKQSIEGLPVYLTDLKTNTDQNLSENPVYTFSSEAGDDPNRFELRFMTPTGLDKTSTQSSLRVYATNGKINISGVDGKAEVFVRNIVGQVFLRNSVNGSTLQSLNTSNLPAGVYMVSVVSATKTVSQKVVVK